MGVDCVIQLPDNVQVKNVAKVVGRLAGLPVEKYNYDHKAWWSRVRGVKIAATADSSPDMVMIRFGDRHAMYFFESEYGGRLLYPKSTAFWCALATRLVDIFGGSVIYADNSDAVDYEVPAKPRDEVSPSDGEAWNAFHQKIIDLKPLHRDEIAQFVDVAGYGGDDGYTYTFDEEGYLTREPDDCYL